jgi:metal-sulfur cluster biosynthetic enzyme
MRVPDRDGHSSDALAPSAGSYGDPATAGVTREQVTQALRSVLDPELGMSVVDLGLVYGIEVRDGMVTVTMTLTAPGCPIHDVMPAWVRQALRQVPGVHQVEVQITYDPPWTPDRIRPG